MTSLFLLIVAMAIFTVADVVCFTAAYRRALKQGREQQWEAMGLARLLPGSGFYLLLKHL